MRRVDAFAQNLEAQVHSQQTLSDSQFGFVFAFRLGNAKPWCGLFCHSSKMLRHATHVFLRTPAANPNLTRFYLPLASEAQLRTTHQAFDDLCALAISSYIVSGVARKVCVSGDRDNRFLQSIDTVDLGELSSSFTDSDAEQVRRGRLSALVCANVVLVATEVVQEPSAPS